METAAKKELILDLNRLHTTTLGIQRIKKNLCLGSDDVVSWCAQQIKKPASRVIRTGKNWYVTTGDCEITVNAHSFTIITAHKIKTKLKS